mmetsp:Transcript_44974/g.143269  ORF Transcript_44974/g.143269 Transcript_44974/m.143269 type:complete len:253 (+) Transcript_44974:731-1489(+)
MRLLRDVGARWWRALMLLVAVWVLSILLAAELLPVAGWLQEAQLGSLLLAASAACLVATSFHANRLSKLKCVCEEKQRSSLSTSAADELIPLGPVFEAGEMQPAKPSGARSLPPVRPACQDEEEESQPDSVYVACTELAASPLCVAVASILATMLAALEGPIFAWAIGSTYKSAAMSLWLLQVLPWELLAQSVFNWRSVALVALVMVVLVAALCLLQIARQEATRAESLPATDSEADQEAQNERWCCCADSL